MMDNFAFKVAFFIQLLERLHAIKVNILGINANFSSVSTHYLTVRSYSLNLR